jgi:hypothetical protein
MEATGMNVEIHNMRRVSPGDGTLAAFNCSVDGWAIYGLRVAAAADGFLQVAGPRTSTWSAPRKRAVEPPREIWLAIVAAALEAYAALPVDEDGDDEIGEAVAKMVG